MSQNESQSQKKKHKKKKKSSSNKQNAATDNKSSLENSQPDNESDVCNIKDILPQKIGMKTVIKDVEVTMTDCPSPPINNEVNNNSLGGKTNEISNKSKKKKKKKNSKQSSSESTEEKNSKDVASKIVNSISTDNLKANKPKLNQTQNHSANEENVPANLLNIIEGNISLVNHPEISVTIANDVPLISENHVPVATSENASTLNQEVVPNAKKKKKKKKKKKNNSNDETVSSSLPPDETSPTEPTYVKLPTDGGNCVLVVSHENFASSNESDKKITQDKITNVQNNSLHENKQNNSITIKNPNFAGNATNLLLNTSAQNKPYALQPEYAVNSNPTSKNAVPITMKNTTENVTSLEENISDSVKNIESLASKPEIFLSSNNSNENPLPNNEETVLTKAQLKAERRAKQEAQRAAKAAKSQTKTPSNIQTTNISEQKNTVSLKKDLPNDPQIKSTEEKEQPRKVRLFAHLPQYKQTEVFSKQYLKCGSKIHPDILEIGAQYAKGIICGSNARCIALLNALKSVIRDYQRPADKEFSRDLETLIQSYMDFVDSCRPLAVSMVNAVKLLKYHLNHLPNETDEVLKEYLCTFIDSFVKDEILLAREAIADRVMDKIVDRDVILVFAYSSLVKDVLCKAYHHNKSFRVVVVDSQPKKEALGMLHSLVDAGIHCSYTHINAAGFVMKEVSKVIIGAHALLSNGCVMSRVGSSQVALVASSFSVPVLVCCETYKFCERSLTDSFVYNELGDSNELCKNKPALSDINLLKSCKDLPSLQLYNLLYDVTPPDLISMVITEKGVLPYTSVPVVLRVRHAGLQ